MSEMPNVIRCLLSMEVWGETCSDDKKESTSSRSSIVNFKV